jgi:hypothetical protein
MLDDTVEDRAGSVIRSPPPVIGLPARNADEYLAPFDVLPIGTEDFGHLVISAIAEVTSAVITPAPAQPPLLLMTMSAGCLPYHVSISIPFIPNEPSP